MVSDFEYCPNSLLFITSTLIAMNKALMGESLATKAPWEL